MSILFFDFDPSEKGLHVYFREAKVGILENEEDLYVKSEQFLTLPFSNTWAYQY